MFKITLGLIFINILHAQFISRAGIRVNSPSDKLTGVYNNTEHEQASSSDSTGIRVKPSLSLTPQKHVISLSNLPAQSSLSLNPWSLNSNVETRIMNQKISNNLDLPPDISMDNVRKLRRILAGKLDTDWTSDIQPRVLRQRGVSGPKSPVDQNSELFKATQNLNITLKDKDGVPYAVSQNELNSFHEWLVERATCEMEYVWDDLGAHFWPRWIRRGVCIDKPNESCSWPPGMKCRPSGSRALQLLHWKCDDASNPETKRRAFGEEDIIPGNRRIRRQVYPYNQGRLWPTGNPWAPSESLNMPTDVRNRMTQGGNWRNRRQSMSSEEIELFRQKRAKRLIRQLSVEEKGLLCFWQNQKYLVSDSCTCSCG